jgi:hypothetical protein
MKCFKCDARAPYATLYRVNAKGQPGIWACFKHRIEPDRELDAIIDAIKQDAVPASSKLATPTGEKP